MKFHVKKIILSALTLGSLMSISFGQVSGCAPVNGSQSISLTPPRIIAAELPAEPVNGTISYEIVCTLYLAEDEVVDDSNSLVSGIFVSTTPVFDEALASPMNAELVNDFGVAFGGNLSVTTRMAPSGGNTFASVFEITGRASGVNTITVTANPVGSTEYGPTTIDVGVETGHAIGFRFRRGSIGTQTQTFTVTQSIRNFSLSYSKWDSDLEVIPPLVLAVKSSIYPLGAQNWPTMDLPGSTVVDACLENNIFTATVNPSVVNFGKIGVPAAVNTKHTQFFSIDVRRDIATTGCGRTIVPSLTLTAAELPGQAVEADDSINLGNGFNLSVFDLGQNGTARNKVSLRGAGAGITPPEITLGTGSTTASFKMSAELVRNAEKTVVHGPFSSIVDFVINYR